jgi:hypothetical protein
MKIFHHLRFGLKGCLASGEAFTVKATSTTGEVVEGGLATVDDYGIVVGSIGQQAQMQWHDMIRLEIEEQF